MINHSQNDNKKTNNLAYSISKSNPQTQLASYN